MATIMLEVEASCQPMVEAFMQLLSTVQEQRQAAKQWTTPGWSMRLASRRQRWSERRTS